MCPKQCTVTEGVLFSYFPLVITNFMDLNFRKKLLIFEQLDKMPLMTFLASATDK